MHPLIGGMLTAQSCSNAIKSVSDATLHIFAIARTTLLVSSMTICLPAWDEVPEVEGIMRFLAPLFAIH